MSVCGLKSGGDCMAQHASGALVKHASWAFSTQVKEEMAENKNKKRAAGAAAAAHSEDEEYDESDDNDDVQVDERASRRARRDRGGGPSASTRSMPE